MPRKKEQADTGPKVFGRPLAQMQRLVALEQLRLAPAVGELDRVTSAWVEERLTHLEVDALGGFSQDAEEGETLRDWVLSHQLTNVEPTVLMGVVYGLLALADAERVAAVMRERAHLRAGQMGPLMRAVHDWLPSEQGLAEAEELLRKAKATAAEASGDQPPE